MTGRAGKDGEKGDKGDPGMMGPPGQQGEQSKHSVFVLQKLLQTVGECRTILYHGSEFMLVLCTTAFAPLTLGHIRGTNEQISTKVVHH